MQFRVTARTEVYENNFMHILEAVFKVDGMIWSFKVFPNQVLSQAWWFLIFC